MWQKEMKRVSGRKITIEMFLVYVEKVYVLLGFFRLFLIYFPNPFKS
jgi:hypothetical protein